MWIVRRRRETASFNTKSTRPPHRRTDATYPDASWPDPLTHLLDEERRLRFQGNRYFDSTRYLTLVYLPPRDVAAQVATWFYEGGETVSTSYGDQLAIFKKTRDDIVHLVAGTLKEIRVLSDDESICSYQCRARAIALIKVR